VRKEKPSYTCMDSAREAGGSPSASEGLALPPLMHRPHPMPSLANSLRHRPQSFFQSFRSTSHPRLITPSSFKPRLHQTQCSKPEPMSNLPWLHAVSIASHDFLVQPVPPTPISMLMQSKMTWISLPCVYDGWESH